MAICTTPPRRARSVSSLHPVRRARASAERKSRRGLPRGGRGRALIVGGPSDLSILSSACNRVVASRHHLETDASFNPGERRLVGGVSLKRAGGGIVVRSPEMVPVGMYSFSLGFLASATLAEAMVLLRGMKVARQRHGVTALRARTDAAHLVEILHGRAKAHDPALRNVVERIAADIELFEDFEIKWARSSHARERQAGVPTADALARKAAGLAQRR